LNQPSPRRLHGQRALAVLEAVARGTAPADQRLDALFREHPEMGKRDRASVSALVYGVLRDALRLWHLAGDAPAGWLAEHLAQQGHAAEAIAALELGAAPLPETERATRLADLPDAARRNLPPDWHAALLAALDDAELDALVAALACEAPTDLRVNTLRSTRGAALAALQAAGIAAAPTPHAASGIRLAQRLRRDHPLLREGHLEPQDEGSQLLAAFVGAQAGETVVDWCAGAGGKSLALAAHMGDAGRVIASDASAGRLARLPPRAARAGAKSITCWPQGDARFAGLRADRVLVDAPCSGSGTLRRAPELRLKPADLAELAVLQGAILTAAARCVRPGGRLVYATCSLFAAENEAVVERFLAAHPGFTPSVEPGAVPTELLDRRGHLRLWPQRHGTDGFFAAGLTRSA
jgi:16S rRNA (cytosine967-C5)-methyltransferase